MGSPPGDAATPLSRRHAERGIPAAARLLAAALLVAAADTVRRWPALMLGNWIPSAPQTAVALFSAGVAVLYARWVGRRSAALSGRYLPPVGPRAAIGSVALLIAALLAILQAWTIAPTYHVLEPAGPTAAGSSSPSGPSCSPEPERSARCRPGGFSPN